MNYLVLGSSGQVGCSLLDFLKNKGENVLEFDLANGCHQDLRVEGAVNHAIEISDFVDSYELRSFILFILFKISDSI